MPKSRRCLWSRRVRVWASAAGIVNVDRIKLDEHWRGISIIHDIGINENTSTRCNLYFGQFIRNMNSKRPAANQKTETEPAGREVPRVHLPLVEALLGGRVQMGEWTVECA